MVDQYFKPHVKRGAVYDAIVATIVGILGLIPLLNCILLPLNCVIGLALPLVIGWFVAQWGRSSLATPAGTTGSSNFVQPAIDGGIATGVGHLVAGIIVFVVSLLLSGLFAGIGVATGSDAGSAATGFAAGAAGGIVGLIITVVGAIVAGAIGAVLYVAIQGNKRTA